MPMFAQSPQITNAGNKRKRSSYSCTASLPARKQSKISTIGSPTTPSPSKNTQRVKFRRSSHTNIEPSLKTILESHLNIPLGPWLEDLKTTSSTTEQKERLLPSTTYMYMQLDFKDPSSYVCVPLPPSLVAQMTTLATPIASPGFFMAKENDVDTLPPQIDLKPSSSLQTPPQTPPRTSALDPEILED